MVLGGEINKEISLVPQRKILGGHDSNKSISGYDGSLMMEKSGVILSDEIRGESSVTPHTRKLNLRMRRRRFPSQSHRRFGRDILPRHSPTDGSIPIQRSTKSTLPPCQKAINFLNTSLIGLVVAKYQGGKSGDPFKANPAPSWSFLAAIVMYFLISLILMEFQRLPSFLSRVASASGVVSSLSLISLLLPKLPGQILLYTSWTLFGVISGWSILESAYNWLLTKIRIVTDGVISFAKNLFTGENTNGQQGLTGENTNSQQKGPPV